jgi:hypothetical protein
MGRLKWTYGNPGIRVIFNALRHLRQDRTMVFQQSNGFRVSTEIP